MIESTEHQAFLELLPLDESFFQATLGSSGASGTIKVVKYMSQGLAALFEYFSDNWQGSKSWNSLEGELSVSAHSDRLGHVFLDVSLRDGTPARWTLKVSIVLEAGALRKLADSARQFEETVLAGSD